MSRTCLCATAGAATVALVLGSGCSKSPADRARELVDPVKEAVASPTGQVDAATAPAVLGAMHTENAAGTAFSFVPGFQAPTGQPQGFGGIPCMDQDGSGNDAIITLDMSCISNGQVSGQIVYQAEIDDGSIYTYYEYAGVCVAAEGICLDGAGATEITGNLPFAYDVTLAGQLNVSANGQTWDFDYGYQMSVSASAGHVSYVVFINGQSYVVDASLSGTGTGSITITGANGSFTCSYSGYGEAGSCSGSAKFDW